MIITHLRANIKNGVCQENMQRLQIFSGPNGSGKTANIDAITLLTSGSVMDLRGRTAKEAAAVRVIKTIGSAGPITVEALFDDGQAVSIAAGEKRTLKGSGPITDMTDLNALIDSWIDGGVEGNMLAFLRFLAKVGEPEWDEEIDEVLAPYKVAKNVIDNAAEKFSLPKLSVLVSIYEMLELAAKKASYAEKDADAKYNILKEAGHPWGEAFEELEKRRAALKEAKKRVDTAYLSLCAAAMRMSEQFDDYSERIGLFFDDMTERFGQVTVRPSLPKELIFGKEQGYPCPAVKMKDGECRPAFHGSQGEWARFYCAAVASRLIEAWVCRTGEPRPYMRYIFSDRGYDEGFISRLKRDFKYGGDALCLQAFICVASGGS